jgi:hypothetical protein
LKDSHADLVAAFSLANLSFIDLWDALLNYTPTQASLLDHAPRRTEYAAAFVNVVLLGILFFFLIRLARWISIRYGIAGSVLGSFPILLLVALPAGKSIVRLVGNRSLDVDPRVLIGVLVLVLAIAAAIAGRRCLKFVSAVLLAISPLIPMEAALSVVQCWTDRSAVYADGPLATPVLQASHRRVVWIIFDDLDYRLSFLDRPSSTPMPAFDRLRAGSLFAENAVSPASFTVHSVPSLLTGKQLSSVELHGPASVLFDGAQASTQPNIFSSVHALGGNVAVVGFYLPYCRLFSRDLTSCFAHTMENGLSERDSTLSQSLGIQQRNLFAYGNRSLLGESPRSQQRVAMLHAAHYEALRDIVDPSLNLVFLHLAVPHAPYLYDRFAYKFPKRYLGAGTYLDNLALADSFLGDFREAMTSAGLWDKTTLVVSSDHPSLAAAAIDGQDDPRVPFLLKLAGQTAGVPYEPLLRTLLTKPLIESILEGQITTSEEAVNWLTTHSN